MCLMNPYLSYIWQKFHIHVHCSFIAAMAHHRCALFLKGFHTSDVSILYGGYSLPMLYHFWNQILRYGIHGFNRTSRKSNISLLQLSAIEPSFHTCMDYVTRLSNLNLQSLEYRRVLVMCYKIVFKLVYVDISDFFCTNSHLHFT